MPHKLCQVTRVLYCMSRMSLYRLYDIYYITCLYIYFSLSAEYYNIMQDGCPSDQYTSLRPRLDLEDRFQTQTFKFQVKQQ